MLVNNVEYKDVLQVIGNTPLAKINLDTPATILAKLEYLNPGGSIKDRPALFMIEDAERKGLLQPGGTIIEASSGNQGIALAMIGAAKGYDVAITVPDATSDEKIATLQAYGAQVFICPSSNDPDDPRGYHAKAQELLRTIPKSFMPNQYYNEQNPYAHYTTTGPEIWNQTNGKITHFISGKGSCGTISGVGKYLKEKNPSIKVMVVDEAPSEKSSNEYKIEGIGVGIEHNLDRSVVDEIILVEGTDSFSTVRKLAREHGILVGLSSGSVMHAILERLDQFKKGDVVVTILADSGRAYLGKII